MAHIHSVYDSDKHFTIDPLSRELKNETPGKASIMQYDHNSERITFDLPMTVEGHRMTDCNRVEVHYLNIDAQTKKQNGDLYDVVDLQPSPADPNIAICSWLIEGKATQLVGPLWFRLRFVCSSAGAVDYAWHTAIYKGLTVSDGIFNTAQVVEDYSDILSAWDERIKALEAGGGGFVGTARTIEVLDTDPTGEDLTEGRIWILRVGENALTTPVIELGDVSENSIAFRLSNASFDGNGAVVPTYNIHVNGVLRKAEDIAPGGVCVVTGLSPETEYQISVRGVSGAVLSAMSNALTATTLDEPDAPPEPMTGLVCVLGVASSVTNGNIIMITDKGDTRANVLHTVGEKACINNKNDEVYYPIPVPTNATSVTVNCPNLYYGYCGYNLSDENVYTYDVDSGWKSSGKTYSFDVGAAEYATISLKKPDNSDLTADDIANITVTFA